MILIESLCPPPEQKVNLPVMPAQIHAALDKRIAGLGDAKRFVSTRMALHAGRAVDMRNNRATAEKNQCILVMGPSGCGKTFLIEQAAAILKIPFVAASGASLTSEGYVGTSVGNVLQMLVRKTAPNSELARYGICFFDEWDKRIHGVSERAGFSQGVQGEILTMMEGTEVPLPPDRPGGRTVSFNTRGLMFVFAGAFEGLEQHMRENDRRSAVVVRGFAPADGRKDCAFREHALREALVAYGMMPEFLNRISGILRLPTPKPADMEAFLRFDNGPLETCNRRLHGLGAQLAVDEPMIRILARHVCETGSYCRGIQSLLQAAVDYIVYEGIKGTVLLVPEDLEHLVEGTGLQLAAVDLNGLVQAGQDATEAGAAPQLFMPS